MTLRHLVWRTLRYYHGASWAVVAGLAVATAVITGSLIIGSSLRGSLLDLSLMRLGGVNHAAVLPRPVSDQIVTGTDALALLQTTGTASLAQGEPNPVSVTVWGVDDGFTKLQSLSPLPTDGLFINAALARDLQVKQGDEVSLSVNRPRAIGTDSLFARRKLGEVMATFTLPVSAVLPDNGPGDFRLDGQSARPRNAFVAREVLQRALTMPGKANVLVAPVQSESGSGLGNRITDTLADYVLRVGDVLYGRESLIRALKGKGNTYGSVVVAPPDVADQLARRVIPGLTLADYGLHLRVKPHSISLTSDEFTLPARQFVAALPAASVADVHTGYGGPGRPEDPPLGPARGGPPAIVEPPPAGTPLSQPIQQSGPKARIGVASIYLATTLKAASGKQLAYVLVGGYGERDREWLKSGEIALNTWAAQDLGASVGQTVTVEYLVPSPDGTFTKQSLQTKLTHIIPITGVAADPHLMPEYEGLTDAATLSAWNPPFPIDMRRVTPRDEQYWDKYKTIPKAFLSLGDLGRMWGPMRDTAISPLTSFEVVPPGGVAPAEFVMKYQSSLLKGLEHEDRLIAFTNTAERALKSSAGSTDFSQLFLALSMFIIAAGAGLAAMLVRLGLERRVKQIGLLLAIGFTPHRVRRLLLAEGMILNCGGVLLGLPIGVLYAGALLKAMNLFWTAAIGDAPGLWLHVGAMDLPYSALGGLLIGFLTILLTLRGLGKLEPMRLWQGGLSAPVSPARRTTARVVTLVVLLAAAAGLLAWALADTTAPKAVAFFGAGALLLAAGLTGLKLALTWPRRRSALQSLRGLAWRNASQNPRRSLLVCGLIAAATFVIIATATSTRDTGRADTFDRAGPSGGFNLMVTSQVPLPYDPSTPAGREHLGFLADDEAVLSRCTIVPLLASPGDDLSCANTAKANVPRLVGYGPRLFADGRFAAVARKVDLNTAVEERGVVAATDAGTLEWRLMKKDGDVWQTDDVYGQPMFLHLYAGFTRSIFAGLLVVDEAGLKRIYPSVTAPSVLLVETPKQDEQAVVAALRRSLADLGLQVRPTREILAEYAAGENVYISMFLALGALGLLLGTVGMAVVTARNVIERRAELAVLTATGFSRARLVKLLLWEHGGLLVLGLALGTAAALIAMLPQLLSPESAVNWLGLTLALVSVLVVGVGANAVAIRRNLADDLVGALRQE